MAEQKYKNFAELDFGSIKDNLKAFLRTQDKLKDFDFDGSVLNTLLDVLAYNDQYQAFYMNMLYSESHINTAQRRDSIVRLARNLGYVTNSVVSSTAILRLTITPTDPAAFSIVIPALTEFTGSSEEGDFIFSNDEAVISTTKNNDGDFIADVELKEGRFARYASQLTTSEFASVVIPNPGIDMNRIRVFVRESPSSLNVSEYNSGYDNSSINPTDNVYFFEETSEERYRIYFGDDIVSKGLVVGNVVEVDYYISSGVDANNVTSFSLSNSITGADSVAISVTESSRGGRDIQDKNQIRDLAPLFLQSQNRAVVKDDYRNLVLKIFPSASSAVAWGGQDNDPVRIGKAYVAVKLLDGFILTETQKEAIRLELKNAYGTLTSDPVVVNAQYINLKPSITLNYDRTATDLSPNDLKTQAIATALSFSDTDLEDFSRNFRFSKFGAAIDNISGAIESTTMTMKATRPIHDIEQYNSDQYVLFGNGINPGSFRSKSISLLGNTTAYIGDDSLGNLNIYYVLNSTALVLVADVGTINYNTGKASINFSKVAVNDFEVDANKFIEFEATPTQNDFVVVRNQILRILQADITVSVIDTESGLKLA